MVDQAEMFPEQFLARLGRKLLPSLTSASAFGRVGGAAGRAAGRAGGRAVDDVAGSGWSHGIHSPIDADDCDPSLDATERFGSTSRRFALKQRGGQPTLREGVRGQLIVNSLFGKVLNGRSRPPRCRFARRVELPSEVVRARYRQDLPEKSGSFAS